MKRNRQKSAACILSALLTAVSGRLAAAQTGTANRPPQRRMVVSIPDRKLAILENGKLIRTFAVAVGAPQSPSPTGEFKIVTRLTNPGYYRPGIVIPAGRDNPLGPRWLGFNRKGYGIHGTNEPQSVGKAASHGCIRLRNHDVEQLFAMVHVGDTVKIGSYEDSEIAQIFGGDVTTGSELASMNLPTAELTSAGQ